LTDDKKLIHRVIPLVKYHYATYNLYKQKAKKSAIRRLSVKLEVASIEELVILAEADYFGRDTSYQRRDDRSDKFEAKEWILEIAKNQNIVSNAPKPIVQGRDLIKMGLNPSPKFKEILDKAYMLQLEAEENDTLSKEELLKIISKSLSQTLHLSAYLNYA
jgi:tRNA nucleotidyltransferase (CCA-adding enzyme)